jgi:hypothetical protein
VLITHCPETALIISNGNATSLRDVSIGRCDIGSVFKRSRLIACHNFDVSKFETAGIVFDSSPAGSPLVVTIDGLFMETTDAVTPISGCPYLHVDSPVEADSIHITGAFFNGHKTDLALTCTALQVSTPTFWDNFCIQGEFNDFDLAAVFTSVGAGEVGANVDLRKVSLVDATPAIPRKIGVRTAASYDIDLLSDEVDLSATGSTRLMPLLSGHPMRIHEFISWATEEWDGAGNATLQVGTEDSSTHWASLTLTEGTLLNALTDHLASFTLTDSGQADVLFFLVNVSAAFSTTGKAKFKMRATVY